MSAGPVRHHVTMRRHPDGAASLRQLAAWADLDQTINPLIVLQDTLGQSVFLGADLPNVKTLLQAFLDWLLIDDESLSVTTPRRLGRANPSHRR
jgi:hypothetical protein